MGFSKEIKEKALVSSARHCCVCNRYKGVKIEVHHIIPKAKGGNDDLKNAIALCFDCHADAGHYNPDHPRGIKLSESELKKHRDRWYKTVEENDIPEYIEENNLYCRYLICRSFDAIYEICQSNLGRFPIDNCMLLSNDIYDFQREICNNYETKYRHEQVYGDSFSSEEEFWDKRPDAIRINPSDENHLYYPYFIAKRNLNKTDIETKIVDNDYLSHLLYITKVPYDKIVNCLAYFERCGLNCYKEIFQLRPFWTVYLAITNISDTQLVFNSINVETLLYGHEKKSENIFRSNENSSLDHILTPSSPIPSNSTIILPIASLLAPFENVSFLGGNEIHKVFSNGRDQIFYHASLENESIDFESIGPTLIPISVEYTLGGIPKIQTLHELNLKNLYILDRYWEMGSCPYLLFRESQTNKLRYVKDLFSESPLKPHNHIINIPNGYQEVLICEFEDEKTYILDIKYGNLSLNNIVLEKGDFLSIKGISNHRLEVTGYYVPNSNANLSTSFPIQKNMIITEVIKLLSNSL